MTSKIVRLTVALLVSALAFSFMLGKFIDNSEATSAAARVINQVDNQCVYIAPILHRPNFVPEITTTPPPPLSAEMSVRTTNNCPPFVTPQPSPTPLMTKTAPPIP